MAIRRPQSVLSAILQSQKDSLPSPTYIWTENTDGWTDNDTNGSLGEYFNHPTDYDTIPHFGVCFNSLRLPGESTLSVAVQNQGSTKSLSCSYITHWHTELENYGNGVESQPKDTVGPITAVEANPQMADAGQPITVVVQPINLWGYYGTKGAAVGLTVLGAVCVADPFAAAFFAGLGATAGVSVPAEKTEVLSDNVSDFISAVNYTHSGIPCVSPAALAVDAWASQYNPDGTPSKTPNLNEVNDDWGSCINLQDSKTGQGTKGGWQAYQMILHKHMDYNGDGYDATGYYGPNKSSFRSNME